MKKTDRIAARAALNKFDLDQVYPIRKSSYGAYICPICGSGTGRHRTGALTIYRNSHRVICYAGNCFGERGEDTLGALRIITGKTETEVLLQYREYYDDNLKKGYYHNES